VHPVGSYCMDNNNIQFHLYLFQVTLLIHLA